MNEAEQGVHAPPTGRTGAMITGLFLLAFGTPFTLVPVLIFGDASIDFFSVMGLIMGLFCTPFVIAGLGVQYLGITMIRLAINPNDANAMKGVERIFGDSPSELSEQHFLTLSPETTPESEETTTERVENFWDSVETESN
tara:strand:- start:129 stop:548 length:420 start_codon:yes stop_codon:yes gene_type:complete